MGSDVREAGNLVRSNREVTTEQCDTVETEACHAKQEAYLGEVVDRLLEGTHDLIQEGHCLIHIIQSHCRVVGLKTGIGVKENQRCQAEAGPQVQGMAGGLDKHRPGSGLTFLVASATPSLAPSPAQSSVALWCWPSIA